MFSESVDINLHDSQALIQIIRANVTYCAWQRAGGKTGGGIGPRIQYLSEIMPRSQILLFSDTYERLIDRVVPNITHFLTDKLKLVEGVDFVKYKKPPEHWVKPIIPLDKFDKVISFATGTALCLVSLAVEGSANAFNAQAGIGDEVKFCNEEQIDSEVLPALRGLEDYFGHLPDYLSVWMFTDKYGPKIKWFLRKRKLVNKRAVETVYNLQMQIIQWQQDMKQYTSSATLAEYKKKIDAYTEKANRIRKHLVYFSDMKPYENLRTLGKFFFRRARKIAKSMYVFNVAYLNHDPDKIEHTFYPTFTNANKYSGINDYFPNKPFFGAMDYNWRICPLPVAQVSKLPGSSAETINVIDYFYELYPLGIEDVIKTFCKKFKSHHNKTFHYLYDHTAKGRTPSKTPFYKIVIDTFTEMGWNVIEHPMGKAPGHDIKFERMKKWFMRRGVHSIRMNEITTATLISSVEQSPAVTSGDETKKDKRTEKDINFPAEDSTHGPDALDMLFWGLIEHEIATSFEDDGIDMTMT